MRWMVGSVNGSSLFSWCTRTRSRSYVHTLAVFHAALHDSVIKRMALNLNLSTFFPNLTFQLLALL